MPNQNNLLYTDCKNTLRYSSSGTMYVVHDGVVIQVRKLPDQEHLQLKTNSLNVACALMIETLKDSHAFNDLTPEALDVIATTILYVKAPACISLENDPESTIPCFQVHIDEALFEQLCQSVVIEDNHLFLNLNGKTRIIR